MGKEHLNSKARFYIKKRYSEGISIYKIAKELGFSHSSISRELKRNTDPDFAIYNNLRAVTIRDKRFGLEWAKSSTDKKRTLA